MYCPEIYFGQFRDPDKFLDNGMSLDIPKMLAGQEFDGTRHVSFWLSDA